MMKELHQKVIHLAGHPQAPLWLFVIAFIESSVFPIPPDILLIPMVMVNFDKAFRYAFICTLGSVLGGIFGYLIGYYGYDVVGHHVVAFYTLEEGYQTVRNLYEAYDIYIVAVAGFSPIPYKVFTILTGFFQTNMMNFILASAVSRGARFFLIAWLLWRGGPRFKEWIEKNLYPITMAASIALVLVVVLVKFLIRG